MTLGLHKGQGQCGMRNLPDTSARDQQQLHINLLIE